MLSNNGNDAPLVQAHFDKEINNHSYIFGKLIHREKETGRRTMARNNRVTLGLFMAAALSAFGGLTTGNTALGQDDYVWNWSSGGKWNVDTSAGSSPFKKDGSDATWENDQNVIFGRNTDTNQDIAIVAANGMHNEVTVNNMTVTGNYTFNSGTIVGLEDGTLTIGSATDSKTITALFNNMIISGGKAKITGGSRTSATFGSEFKFDQGLTLDEDVKLKVTAGGYKNVTDISGGGTIDFNITNGSDTILTLAGNTNNFTGNVGVSAGTLNLSGSSFKQTQKFEITDGHVNVSKNTFISNLAGTGGITVADSKLLTLLVDGEQKYDGVIEGDGGVAIGVASGSSGSLNQMEFTKTQTYEADTTVGAGSKLILSGSGSIASSSGLNLNGDNATLELSNIDATLQALNSTSSTSNVELGTQKLTIENTNSGSLGSFAGNIVGTGDLVVKAQGKDNTLTLSGDVGIENVDIQKGTLALSGAGTFKNENGDLLSPNMKIGDAGVFDIQGISSDGVTLSSLVNSDIPPGGTVSGATVEMGEKNLSVKESSASSGTPVYAGTIKGENGAVLSLGTDTNTDTFTFSNANSDYKGTIDVAAGNTLALTSTGSFEKASLDLSGTGSALTLGSNATFKSLEGADGSTVALTHNLTLTNNSGTFNGLMSGSGGLTLEDGSLTLTKQQTFTGATTISGGTLALSGAGNVSSNKIALDGGTFDVTGITPLSYLTSAQIESKSGSTIALGAKNLNFNTGSSSTIAGNITGTGNVTINSSVIYSGDNKAYSGTTTINNGGSLDMQGGSIANSSLTVGTGGIFSGWGAVQNVTIAGGTFNNDSSHNTLGQGSLDVGNFTMTSGILNFNTSNGAINVNSSGNVLLTGGTIGVKAAGAGVYTLFKGGSLDNRLNHMTGFNVSVGTNDKAAYIVDDSGPNLVIWAYNEGSVMQVWDGGADGKWNNDDKSWQTMAPDGSVTTQTQWKGNVAVFQEKGPETITVGNNVSFEHLQVSGTSGNRTFKGSNLFLNPSAGSPAIITVNDDNYDPENRKTVTFESALRERASGTDLLIAGNGVVVLDNANNKYSGYTTIGGNSVFQLNKYNSGITGGMILKEGGTLALNYGGTFSNVIKNELGASTSDTTVAITKYGETLRLNKDNTDFKGKMHVYEGATLQADVANAIGRDSTLVLEKDSTFKAVNGNQIISYLNADDTSTINLAGNSSLTLNSLDYDVAFNGTLTGSGNFRNIGGKTTLIGNLDTAEYRGAFESTTGTLALNGIGDKMTLRIANGMASNSTGKYLVAAEKDLVIQGGSLNGREIEVASGALTLDRESESVLNSGSLTLTGSSGMYVNDHYDIGNLTLGGGSLYFIDGTSNTANGAPLTVKDLDVGSGTNVYINIEDLGFNVDNHSFFDMDTGDAKEYLVSADNVTGKGPINMLDINGGSLKDAYEYAIHQGGANIGSAYLKTDSGVDDNGIHFSQQLTKLESYGGSQNIRVSSSTTTTVGPQGRATLNADLVGDGGYTFEGNKDIQLNGKNNAYAGTTVISMEAGKTVHAGADNAFGNTSMLDLQSGNVNLNGKGIKAGGVKGLAGTTLSLNSGALNLTNSAVSTPATYSGLVTGTGNITKAGAGTQVFANSNNSVNGNITLDGGALHWAGNLNRSSGGGNVNVNSGVFRQLNSTIGGDVNVTGANSEIEGNGRINGNLVVDNGATYRVTATSGALDSTIVGGSAYFGQNTDFAFANDALAYMASNPNASLDVLQTGNGLDLSNSPWSNGIINIDLGILGTATVVANGGSMSYQGITSSGNTIGSITNSWRNKGVDISDVIDRSNIGQVAAQTVTTYLWDQTTASKTNSVINARFANAKMIGNVQTNLNPSRTEALSLFNYDSGYTATLPVQAAMDTTRAFVGQGLKNRINNLRAARAILSTPAFGFAPGFGYAQSTGAYASTIVQDTFGYNAPAYLGATYYDPYTGSPCAAPAGYGYAPQTASYAPAMGYAPPASDNGFNLWAGGVGNWNKQKTSSGGIGGYTYDAGGFMIGADYIAGPVVFGAAFGYSRGTLEDEEAIMSNSKIDAYSANLYADYNHHSGVNTMLFGGYTWFDNEIERTVAGYRDNDGILYSDYGTEKHDYHSNAWYAGASVGYDFIPTSRLTLTPSVGVEWYQAEGKSHTRELRRNSGVVLRDDVEKMRARSLTAPIDVAATYDVIRTRDTKLSLMGNVGYAYEFMDKGAKGNLRWMDTAGSPTVEVMGRKPGRSGLNLGAGARFQKNCMSFDVKYDFYKRKDNTSHRVAANIGWSF